MNKLSKEKKILTSSTEKKQTKYPHSYTCCLSTSSKRLIIGVSGGTCFGKTAETRCAFRPDRCHYELFALKIIQVGEHTFSLVVDL